MFKNLDKEMLARKQYQSGWGVPDFVRQTRAPRNIPEPTFMGTLNDMVNPFANKHPFATAAFAEGPFSIYGKPENYHDVEGLHPELAAQLMFAKNERRLNEERVAGNRMTDPMAMRQGTGMYGPMSPHAQNFVQTPRPMPTDLRRPLTLRAGANF